MPALPVQQREQHPQKDPASRSVAPRTIICTWSPIFSSTWAPKTTCSPALNCSRISRDTCCREFIPILGPPQIKMSRASAALDTSGRVKHGADHRFVKALAYRFFAFAFPISKKGTTGTAVECIA